MLKDKTYRLQATMSEFVRNGEHVDLPVDSKMRLGQYRRLVYNVVKSTLDQAYPIAAKHLGEENWNQLVHDFFSVHSCQHPQVWRMPREVMDFVKDHHYDKKLSSPHLLDLLRLEWLEIEVHSMPDQEVKPSGEIGDLMATPLYFNPHFKLERFDFPVHKIHEVNPADHAGEYYILIFRANDSGRVHFTYLQPVNAVILDSLIQNPGATPTEVFHAVCENIGMQPDASRKKQLEGMLDHLVEKKFILGADVL